MNPRYTVLNRHPKPVFEALLPLDKANTIIWLADQAVQRVRAKSTAVFKPPRYRDLIVVPTEAPDNGLCIHGLPGQVWSEHHQAWLPVCAVCEGPVRVPKPVWSEHMMPKRRRDVVATPQQLWTIPHAEGLITICGACLNIASTHDGSYDDQREREVKLVAFLRTSKCKHCGGLFNEWDACPKRPEGHERRWLVQSVKVPACLECAEQAIDFEVDFDDLTRDEHGRMARQVNALNGWREALAERGLL